MLHMNRRLPALPVRRLAARGFSLIEVLVSMVIVSLGILALAGLLQSASRYGKMSELRSTATLLANDIADHIRANPDGATKMNAYNVTSAFPATAAKDNRLTAGNKCDAADCDAKELGAVDLYFWSARVLATLPQGTPFIQYNAALAGGTQNGSVDVWVAWMDPSTSAGGGTERPDTECPAGLSVSAKKSVRCVYLQVGL
jgi:type IV pilus assembly protein PilV